MKRTYAVTPIVFIYFRIRFTAHLNRESLHTTVQTNENNNLIRNPSRTAHNNSISELTLRLLDLLFYYTRFHVKHFFL